MIIYEERERGERRECDHHETQAGSVAKFHETQ
jgi:hypothetical protein